MTANEQMRRLEQLEAQARAAELERSRHDPAFRATAEEYAARFDLNVDALIEGTLEIAQRIAEVGQDAYERETAERYGMTVEEFRAYDLEAEWEASRERDRARRANTVYWRQGVMYRGGVPVTE